MLFQVLFFLKNFFGWLFSIGCCCNLLKGEFNLEETFLDVLNIQTVFWLSVYFSPFLGMFAFVYYLIKFYLTMITLRVFTKLPDKKALIESKINNSFFFVLFINFLLVLLIYGIMFNTWVSSWSEPSSCFNWILIDLIEFLLRLRPSRSCGPFQLQITEGNYDDFTILGEFNNVIHQKTSEGFIDFIEFVFSNLFLWTFSFLLV